MAGRLILVTGLPGSGKTTLARQLEAETGGLRFCPDDWISELGLDFWDEALRARIEALQWKIAQRVLASGGVAIIEWGTWARSERDALREGAHALGASAELRYLSAPLDVLIDRIERRGTGNPPLTKAHLEQFALLYEVPTPGEVALYDASFTVQSNE